jgi:hypothetical protein
MVRYSTLLYRDLALRCCRLMLVLIKRLRDTTEKSLHTDLRMKIGKESTAEGKERLGKQTSTRTNAQNQISALLSFKEALSTGKDLHISVASMTRKLLQLSAPALSPMSSKTV